MNNIFYGCKSLEFIPNIDLTNIKNKQKIIHTPDHSCEKIHNFNQFVYTFLNAVRTEDKTFIKIFEAFLGDNKADLNNKNSPGYMHANDALILALYTNDCENLDTHFQLLLNW